MEGSVNVNIIAWILVGLIAGALAKLLIPGDQPGGCIVTTILGIVGAIVGGFLWGLIGGDTDVTGFNLPSVLVATGGAIVVLVIWGLIASRR
jgi:uncharacterized membrane protein YeaQ/YmgE (transglycosylase-associated protein family)